MIFYRTFLAAVAAAIIVSPVFADETALQASSRTAPAGSVQPPQMAEVKINVNKATAKELLKIKGMNPAKARAIVTYRKKHGEFKSMDDLAKVKAMAKMKPDELKEILNQLSLS
jgi:competence protein ComEA